MAVNEALSCDRNRFLVGISNLKKSGASGKSWHREIIPIFCSLTFVFRNYEGEKQDLCESKLKLEGQVKQLEETNSNLSSELEMAKAKGTTDADNVNKEVAKMAEIIESLQNDKLQTDKQLAEGTQLLAKVGFRIDA